MDALRSAVFVAVGSCLVASPARSDESVEEFYKGTRITLIVAADAGSGNDAYARLFAGHFARFMPGQPTIAVQNMPAAGGLNAINYLYNVAPKTGAVLGNVRRSAPLMEILGRHGVRYESAKLNWLGSLNNEVTVCTALKTAAAQTFEDTQRYEVLTGGTGPNDTETSPAILNNTLGARFKIISGYGTNTAVAVAMERGEVEAMCSSYAAQKRRTPTWFSEKRVNILIQMSTRKHPDLPNVPLAIDLAPTPEIRALLEVNDSGLEMGRPFAAPPGVPQDRVTALRTAFWTMANDKEFQEAVTEQNLEANPVSGEDVQHLIERISTIDKTILEKLDDAIIYKGTKGHAKIAAIDFLGEVTALNDGGREAVFKGHGKKTLTVRISKSQTKVTIAGVPAKRGALTAGMTCKVKTPAPEETATEIDCNPLSGSN